MKLNSISGVSCLVKDLAKTVAFYEALGFRIGKQDDKHVTAYVNWFFVDFIADSAADQQTEASLPNRGAGHYLHLKVENADEFYEGVVAAGMTPDGKPEGSRSTGRSFVLRDPDGYKLVFFEKK
jgi:catechol 2,3-dioxygenase-like lactoylglutathione lyase family enzyme